MKAKSNSTAGAGKTKAKSSKVSTDKRGHDRSLYLDNLIDHISDALIATDMEFSILEWNAAAERIYGWNMAEVLGHPLQEFIQSEYSDNTTREDAAKAVRTEGVWKGEVTHKRRDGTRFPVMASVSLVKDKMGQPMGFAAINRDLTEFKRAEEKTKSLAKFPDENINPVLRFGEDGKLLFANRASSNLLTSWDCEIGGHPPVAVQWMISESLTTARSQEMEVAYRDVIESLIFVPVMDRNYVNVYGRDITERKRAEEALRLENERFLHFIESNIVGIVIAEASGKIILANDYYLKILGVTRQDFLDGKVDWKKFTPLEWLQADEKAIAELRERGICGPYEKEFERADGTRVPVYLADAMLPGPGEQIAAFVLDITEPKRAEERFASAFHSSPMPITITRVSDGTVVDVNKMWCQVFGYTREEALGCTSVELGLTDETTRQQVMATLEATGLIRNIEVPIMTRSGEKRDILYSMEMLKINGEPHALTTLIDITERKQAEERLILSEIRYRRLFESAKDGILILDAETGMIVDVNPFLITLLGYSEETILGKNIWELGFFKDILANKANFLELQQEEYIRYEDLPLETALGRRMNVEFVSNVYEANHKKVIQCNIRDITERKRAEEQIQRQLKHLNALRMIDTAINSSFDLDVILEVVLQQVLAELGVDASDILLFNPQLQTIEYAASRGFRAEALYHTRLKLGEGYAGRAVLERKTTHISDLMQTGGKLANSLLLERESFVDYYGTPLIVKGEVKGVLEVYHRSHLKADSEWLEFLEALSGQAAIAIDNAQLFENLQRSNVHLEHRVVERTAELNQTNTELEHANRVKDEFLANMSHELRTPLTSILGMSESLLEQRRGSLDDHQKRSLEVIESSGQHLLELINDILDLSKIEAGKLDYYPQPVSVDDICRSSLSFIKAQAAKKSITITYLQNISISKIFADPRRLKQILVNLLTNAVKFTHEKGEVILQVNADLEQDLIKFSVIDNGIGISPEDLQRLFQPFVQVDSGLSRQHEGTGLGLTLVQKLIDLHGGSVQVESEVGKGSRFTITLPCLRDEATKLEKLEEQSAPPVREWDKNTEIPPNEPAHLGVILLADDNMPSILTIGEYLESHGYEIVVAHDGVEAIERAEAIQPDLILMDIQMPVMNGLEAIARLRGNPQFAATPIIALTALAMPGDRERTLLAGANEYMSKPVSLKALRQKIPNLLHGQSDT